MADDKLLCWRRLSISHTIFDRVMCRPCAISFSPLQNAFSRLTLVLCPLMTTERLTIPYACPQARKCIQPDDFVLHQSSVAYIPIYFPTQTKSISRESSSVFAYIYLSQCSELRSSILNTLRKATSGTVMPVVVRFRCGTIVFSVIEPERISNERYYDPALLIV
jgi:hypothetical protein